MSNPQDPAALSPLKRALLALEDMKARLDASERGRREPIAIIGLGCRFPGGANDPDQFWRVLSDGVDAVTDVPRARWNADLYYDPDPDQPGKSYVRQGAFLDEFDRFDPQFFGIAPREAAGMDPQQRLLLEVAWEALEDAAVSPEAAAAAAAGVFVGINSMDYAAMQLQRADLGSIDAYSLSGTSHSIAAGRLAYVLGLQGPTMAVDTACSSSLVAVHLACQSLRNDECRIALAGGVQVTLSPLNSVVFSKLHMLAADGRCKTFDARGDGFVEGEGCAVLVLKRLSHARADGDRVIAVIPASAVNQDGASSGLTAPNGPSQEAVIRAALTRADIRPADVDYIEAHGTGTALGDPIEVQALAAVFGEGRAPERPLLIGSVKTNLGHTQAAAGVAGLVKLALALDREVIPRSLHFEQPNPHVPWSTLPLKVVTEATPWPRGAAPRVGGVSSFGFSGTNAHVLVAEAPPAAPAAAVDAAVDRPLHVLALSARTETALAASAARWASRLKAQPDIRLADAAYSANAGRAHQPERAAIVAATREDLVAQLEQIASTGRSRSRGRAPVDPPKLAFLFTGQGAQYAGMGKELYDSQPIFRSALDACAERFDAELDVPLLSVMYPPAGAPSPIDETRYAQPALFALEYALAQLWKSWGVVPAAVLGHSIGEYSAACLAGVFSLDDAVRLVALRGRLMQSLPAGGAMAAVFADEEVVAAANARAGGTVSIGAENAAHNVVISGPEAAVSAILASLARQGVSGERLTVSHAFHSALMDPILDEFAAAVDRLRLAAPAITVISNLTGAPARGEIRTAAYWRRHLRESVRFARGAAMLRDMGCTLFLELGPRPTLSGLAARTIGADATILPSLRRAGQDWQRMLESLAELYVRGGRVDWAGFDRGYTRRKLAMPTYPFERERHWLPGLVPDAAASSRAARVQQDASPHPLLGRRLSSALDAVQFEALLSAAAPGFLGDHRKRGAAVVPATAYLEMGFSAAGATGIDRAEFAELVISEPLVVGDDPVRVQTILTPAGPGAATFQVYRCEGEGAAERWHQHASGALREGDADAASALEPIEALRRRCQDSVALDDYYRQLETDGHYYGPAFRGLVSLWRGDWEALGEIVLPSGTADDTPRYRVHPALLDAALQVLGAAIPRDLAGAGGDTFLPVSLGRCRVHVPGATAGWSHVRLTRPAEANPDGFSADVRLFDSDGRLIAEVTDVYHKRLSASALDAAARKVRAGWLFDTEWRVQPRAAAAAAPDAGTWVVVGDAGHAIVDEIRRRLAARGARVVSAVAGEPFAAPDGRLRGVVHVPRGIDAADVSSSPDDDARRESVAVMHLLQAIDGMDADARPALALITSGAVAVHNGGHAAGFWQAPLCTLARTIALEQPDLRCVALDLDPHDAVASVESAVDELLGSDPDLQVAFRRGQRLVPRLVHSAATASIAAAEASGEQSVSLEIAERGVLDHLQLQPAARRAPGPGEVELRVKAAGLNFRDVLNALGVYEGDAGPLGYECIGTVVAVGPGVEHLAVGDDVMGMAPGTFRTYVTAPAGPLVVKPAGLSDEDAAAIPIAFLTADHALNALGRLRAGERILIHAAAGGVGLAAVQLARRAGAEIFATASVGKHDLLRSMGITHIFNSRSLEFADQIREATGGRGVDVVLNSLAGEFIDRSLSVLTRGGRFLEIGKAGIWSAERMAAARPDVEYYPIYFTPDDHPQVRRTLSAIADAIASGALPALPRRAFPAADAVGAFRYMAQARHVGKIVLTFPAPHETGAVAIGSDATYLITGGLGALGLSVAKGLVDAGARHLVLTSRQPPSKAAAETIRQLQDEGAAVTVVAADVADAVGVRDLLARIDDGLPPLRGIVHAAGVVDDGLLVQQTAQRLHGVFAPKAAGAWHLHQQTGRHRLDFFVMFSSMVSLFGGPGQGTYAAANGFLDGLAAHRRARGLSAVSVQWGPWAGAGMAARVSERDRQRWVAQGVGAIAPSDGAALVTDLIRRGSGASIAVLPIDWARWFRQFAAGRVPPLVTELAAEFARPAAPRTAARLLTQELEGVAPNRRRAVVWAFLHAESLKVLGLGSGVTLDPRQPLSELGLDSLMAVELRNTIAAALARSLPATLLFKYPTLDALGEFVMSQVDAAAEATAGSKAADDQADVVAALSDEEAKALLAEELESLSLLGVDPEDTGRLKY
jgi:myxalamid-type polyketide synthase MxaB